MANILNTKAHSIIFKTDSVEYNTFNTWGLVPAKRPYVVLPPLKSKTVDLPASDGILDYTELLLGKTPFGRRSGSWTFYTDLDKQKELGFTWDTLYADLVSKLHGKEFQVTLDDDPDYYYKGRLGVSQWRSSKSYSEIGIDYNFESFKYSYTSSDDVDWQWDDAIEDPGYKVLYGNYQAGTIRAINYLYEGHQETTPTYTFEQDCVVVSNIGILLQNLLLGHYGYTTDQQRQSLTLAGYTANVVLNRLNMLLKSSTRYPEPDPSEYTPKTTQAILAGELDLGQAHEVQAGIYTNTELNIRNGDNIIVMYGDGSVHVKYQEASL